MKYLLLLALAAYVYYSWRKQRGIGRSPSAAHGGASRSARGPAPQEMVACAACGLHLPREEALADGRGRLYCSPQHRDQGGA